MNYKTLFSRFIFPLELDVTTTALNCLEYIKGSIVFTVPVKWVNTHLMHFVALQTCFIKIRCWGKWGRHLRSRGPLLRVVFMPVKRCKCSNICYSLCKMQGHHLAGVGVGVWGGSLVDLSPLMTDAYIREQMTNWSLCFLCSVRAGGRRHPELLAQSVDHVFAGGREGERDRSCVQRERCRLLDLVSSRFPLTHNRQGALCSTTMETGWNNKAQIALLCVFGVFFKSIFLSHLCFMFSAPLLFSFRGACILNALVILQQHPILCFSVHFRAFREETGIVFSVKLFVPKMFYMRLSRKPAGGNTFP